MYKCKHCGTRLYSQLSARSHRCQDSAAPTYDPNPVIDYNWASNFTSDSGGYGGGGSDSFSGGGGEGGGGGASGSWDSGGSDSGSSGGDSGGGSSD